MLEHDLDREGLTVADVMRATAFALPAIEIVGSRIANWNIRIVDTVADNASSGLYVIGNTPVPLAGLDPTAGRHGDGARGEPVSVGVGAACLGHPLNAARCGSRARWCASASC